MVFLKLNYHKLYHHRVRNSKVYKVDLFIEKNISIFNDTVSARSVYKYSRCVYRYLLEYII